MASNNPTINYYARDFSTLKSALASYAQTYFPDTYNDFSPSSTGMLFMNMAAYVGDILSFYLDNQIQETFLPYAIQTENIYALAYMLGYTPKVVSPASAVIDVYQQIPAIISNSIAVPDYSYGITIPAGTSITPSNNSSIVFSIANKIDFTVSSSSFPTDVSVYQVSNGVPTYFLLKKSALALEGNTFTKTFQFGAPVEFPTITIQDNSITRINSCIDTDGNPWYEVSNLAQDTIFDTINNTNPNDPNLYTDNPVVPSLLRLKTVERRFATRFLNPTTLEIQFGNGGINNTTETIIPNPDNVGLGLPYESTKLTTAFSPTNFIFSNTYGIAPSNTTLTISYNKSVGSAGNLPAGSLVNINKAAIQFKTTSLNSTVSNYIINSVTCTNPQASTGGANGDTINDIKQNALGNFQNQLRTVTLDDYLIRAYSMPSYYGTISKAHITPEKISNLNPSEIPSALNLYILSETSIGTLTTASLALKQNLQTYLSAYRSINDSIKIKDAFIINIGVKFDIVTRPNYVGEAVINLCVQKLTNLLNSKNYQINQAIILSDLYSELDRIEGVQTVKNIEIFNITGDGTTYSSYAYDVKGATINDVVYPSIDPMIFELKYPNIDIKGRIVSF